MKKVVIIGSGGAGKTTFSRRLANKTGLPLFHLDQLYWKPGWTRPSPDEWRKIHQDLLKQKSWIIDGHYKSTLAPRVAAADTVVFLDYPKWLILYRAVKRRVMFHHRQRPELGFGNPERLTWQFLQWLLTFPRKDVLVLLRKHASKNIVILKTPKEAENFLRSISA